MKIDLKIPREIKIMQKGGKLLSGILKQLCQQAKPGVNLLEIEKKARHLIKKTGGKPSFKMVKSYQWATCLNINEGVVHGVPKDYSLKPGDLLTIDVGLFYKGFHTDSSCTIKVKSPRRTSLRGRQKAKVKSNKKVDNFLKTGRKALKEAIKVAIPGNHVGHISAKIQEIIEGAGYVCIRTLTGHGIGKKLHEPPLIPCFLKEEIRETPKLKKGMTLAIEVIYAEGSPNVVTDKKDGWTVKTDDGKIAAVFEESIVVLDKPQVLTPLLFLRS